MGNLQGLILPVAFLAIFYFLLIRPQKKKEKKIKEMRANLEAGQKIVTIGGIMGKITKIKEDIVTIEVGSDKTKFNVAKWAIGSVQNEEENEK